MFGINSDLTFKTPLIFLRFSKCELPMLVIIQISGLRIELK